MLAFFVVVLGVMANPFDKLDLIPPDAKGKSPAKHTWYVFPSFFRKLIPRGRFVIINLNLKARIRCHMAFL